MATESAGPTSRVQPSAYGCITVPFLLLTALVLGWGARNQWANGDLARHGDVVPGLVTELRYVASNPGTGTQSSRGGQSRGSSPVVTFTTRTGEQLTMIGSVNRYPPPWRVGETIDVIYDPANPARADLRSEVSGWVFWFGFWCVFAAVPLAIAMLPIVMRLRER
jgi:hypothetical protein